MIKFKELMGYLKESKKYIYSAALIFFAGADLGYFFNNKLDFLEPMLRELVEKVKGMSMSQLIFFIFKNNLSSAFFAMLFGIFLGIVPLFNAAFNGVVLGYVFAKASAVDGVGVFFKLLPHGVFELPAIMIALGMGLRIGLGFMENFFIWYKKDAFRRFLGVIAIITGFLGMLFIIFAISGFLTSANGENLIFASVSSLVFGLVLVFPLISLLFFGDRKLRKVQKKVFGERFYQAVKVFVFVVLPLLLIAAVIEGVLMFLYKS